MTGLVMVAKGGGCGGSAKKARMAVSLTAEEEQNQNQLSPVTALLAALRRSMASCRVDQGGEDGIGSVRHHMEIGWPTNVRHIAHVTFDRFHGFLGLPVEFEVEIPSQAPSASVSVFGVSAESMQCSYDSKGNSIPSILLLMQERLYSQGGLKAEGIFRINPENSQEEELRDQLNRGVIPDNIDVHCLAGLIKAWFRELPCGVLDGLSPEQVLECNTDEESFDLVKQLKPTEAALLNWAVDLMADVVEEEEFNKMNARNIAMVFAPNMTQMSDPLTALMHAVQVMNLLQTLIAKSLRDRDEETATSGRYSSTSSHSLSGSDYDTHMSCELRPSTSSDEQEEEEEEEQEEGGSEVDEIEACFLRQLDAVEDVPIDENDSSSSDRQSVESVVIVDDSKLDDDDDEMENSVYPTERSVL